MKQLSGLDAAFVHQDSHRTPMHITAVLIYDIGAGDRQPIQKKDLKRLSNGNLQQFPLFRRRLHRVPLDIDTPYWVDVRNSRSDEHLSELTYDGAGSWRGFQQLLTRLHNRRMDLSRPLWEMCLVHGLNDLPDLPPHCQAIILKVHHAVIDGMSLAGIVDAMHRETVSPGTDDSMERSTPTYPDMWARLGINTVDRQFKLARTMGKFMPGFLQPREAPARHDTLPPVLKTGSHFNDRLGKAKSTGTVLWPKAGFLAIRRVVRRVTLNDIALSIVAGALREYLLFHRNLPPASLVCGVPINLRGTSADPGGNHYATMRVGLATSVDDPIERLRLVHGYALAGKRQISSFGSGTIMDISDSLSPNILAGGIRMMAEASRIADLPVPFHTMLSNVPGPKETLRLGEAKLVVPLGFGPVRDNLGLFHVYSDSPEWVSLSFTACVRLMPDAGFYQHCLQNAYANLHEQATDQPAKRDTPSTWL